MHHHLPQAALLALESDGFELSTLCRQAAEVADALAASVAGSTSGVTWRGAASDAFDAALVVLRREVSGAVDLLAAAEQFVVAALREEG